MAIDVVKKHRSTKPPSVKARVLLKYANGDGKRKIARDLDIGRPTVDAIIKEANVDQFLASGEILCAELIPDAVSAMKVNLQKNSFDAAKFILEPVWNNENNRLTGKSMGVDLKLQQAINILVQPQDKPAIDVHAEETKE